MYRRQFLRGSKDCIEVFTVARRKSSIRASLHCRFVGQEENGIRHGLTIFVINCIVSISEIVPSFIYENIIIFIYTWIIFLLCRNEFHCFSSFSRSNVDNFVLISKILFLSDDIDH